LEENYPAQGEFAQKLQDFAKQTMTHVHLVAHLGKPPTSPPKGHRPSMYSIKGSSLLTNNVDNIVLIQRNLEKTKEGLTYEQKRAMHDAEVIIEKQRETGWLDVFKLKYDPIRRTYSKLV
jgi:twinkle protein